jgi:hypothetical protein
VTETDAGVEAILGVPSGSASAKLILDAPIVNVALALTVALTVKGFVSNAAKAPPAIKTKPKPIANTKLTFFIFSSSFSFLIPSDLGDEGNHFLFALLYSKVCANLDLSLKKP